MKQESWNKGEIVKCLKIGSIQRNKLIFKIKILKLLNLSIDFIKEWFLHFIFKGKENKDTGKYKTAVMIRSKLKNKIEVKNCISELRHYFIYTGGLCYLD